MNVSPREFRTTYEEVVRLWPDLDVPKKTDNGTTLRWYFMLGGPYLSQDQIKRLGKRPLTQTRNVLKYASDLWLIGGSRVVLRRAIGEPSWRTGIFGSVPQEVIDCIEAELVAHPL